MHPLSLLAIEVGLSLLLSGIVVGYLHGVLHALLAHSCPHEGGLFWIRTLSLLQYLAPLLLVIWRADLFGNANVALELRNALSWMLLGHCIALLLLARIIWTSLVLPAVMAEHAA